MSQEYETNLVEPVFKEAAQESTTALGSNGVFTGPWIDLGAGGGKVSATSRADQSGTLTVQESPDKTATQTIASVATTTVGGKQFATASAVTAQRYARVVYTNGATAQGSFELDRLALT